MEQSKTYIDDGSGKLHDKYKPDLRDYDGMMVEKASVEQTDEWKEFVIDVFSKYPDEMYLYALNLRRQKQIEENAQQILSQSLR